MGRFRQGREHSVPRATWRRTVVWLAGGLLVVTGVLALAGGLHVRRVAAQTPDIGDLRQATSARASLILSADGEVLGRFSRARRDPVTLDRVSPQMLKALIATEDHRFHEHRGIDYRRTVAAIARTLTGTTQGGSTITQQLARNLFPQEIGRDRSLSRKIKEMATALRIERHYSKQQILEAYLNSAPFLYNVVGIEMAARTYFDTTAADLDTLQSATLVGMLKGTDYYNPVRHPERAKARRNVVLGQMARHGQLEAARLQTLAALPLQLQFNRPDDPAEAAPHFVAHVRKQVLEWADQNDRDLYGEGLVIHTTLDARLQQAATEAVERQAGALQAVADVEWSQARLPGGGSLASYARRAARSEPFAHFWDKHPGLLREHARSTPEYRDAVADGRAPDQVLQALFGDKAWLQRLKTRHSRLEAGFVAVDPHSGRVLAWVGSRDFGTDQFDHVAQARRQPGSTFKPFVYAAALEAGMASTDHYMDTAVEVPLRDGRSWRPTDMSGASELPMTLRDGLALSKNSITAQVSQAAGVHRVARLARDLGVDQSPLDEVPSLALGTSPVTLLEMVGAYATLARQGERRDSQVIDRIVDRHGSVLAEFGSAPRRVLSQDSAVELVDILRDAVDRGTGTAVRRQFGITADVAGKTGTSQDNADGWFILMHPDLVAGAWVGFNDQRVTMRSNGWGQGGRNALLLVGDFFRSGLKQGWIDARARFPTPKRAAPVPLPSPVPVPRFDEDLLAARVGSAPPARGPESVTGMVGGGEAYPPP
jgi:penicillin-binding protein 1A